MRKSATIRFAADKTVGKLAKWLRLLGFDTLYESDAPKVGLTDQKCKEDILSHSILCGSF